MKDKRGFEFSFAWLFAIIAGAAILFLAIYGAVQIIGSNQDAEQTKAAKEISILFNPLETGLASGRASVIRLNPEARIYNTCAEEGSFGSQSFSVSQKSGFLKEWPSPGAGIKIYNKYVFSEKIEQGKEIYFFSKPFNIPFKVSELIFMSTKNYCFENAPEFISGEIERLQIKNIKLQNCTGSEIKVCFDSRGAGCNISIYGDCIGNYDSEYGKYEFGHAEKDGKTIYYISSLIYGAIFSDAEIYSCNFKRLMMRLQQISSLYSEESRFISTRGCGGAISPVLKQMSSAAEAAKAPSGSSILNLKDAEENLDNQNSAQLGCGIY